MYLVDGNNVMGQRVGWHRDKPAAQRRLLADLARFGREQELAVTVVFDGRPLPEAEDGGLVDGVRVHYARPGRDADDRIVELAAALPSPKAVVAVSSDRGLRARLAALGIETMRSGQFRKLLDEGGTRSNS